ncbi:MAG: hypothetical protein IIT39_17190, partial [Clostridia bacterium]|nr:hypothetical protein [Clostridia bacterium]
ENGKTLTVTKKDKPEYGNGTFIKTSEDGVIEGIKLHIYGTSNTGVAVDETITTDVAGKANIKLLVGTYTVEEIKVANRYVFVPRQTIKIEKNKTSEVKFNNILKKGKLIIEKVSSKNPDIKLSGTLFTVFDNKGNKVSDLTETEEGIYTLSNLLYGSYSVKEITAPTGYLLDTGSYNFKITQDKQVVVISNSDDKKFVEMPIEGNIEILKVDSTNNKPLSGAEFTLYNADGDVVQKLTTGKDGKVTFKEVPYGKYTVKETKAPDYYELDSTPIPFEILENGKTLTVTKKDIPEYGKGTFIKTSEDDIVEGIKLHIYGTSNTGVAVDEVITTDAEGKANLELLVGTYTVEEVKAADRYITPSKQTITIKANKTSTVTFHNILKRGGLLIEKINSKYPEIKISGAVFTVYKDGKKYADVLEIAEGIYSLTNIPHGSYVVKEITAPTGYLLDNGSYSFEIKDDDQQVIISNNENGKFVEVPIEGNIEILKVDSTNNTPLSGAEFALYNADGDVIQTLMTGKDGKVTFKEVPYGKYTVKETKAPKYYELDDTAIPFEILENGKTLTATKTDKPEYGKGTFIKTSEDGVIEGIELHIYGTSNT